MVESGSGYLLRPDNFKVGSVIASGLKFGESNPNPVFSQRLDSDHFKVPSGASMLATLYLCVRPREKETVRKTSRDKSTAQEGF